MMTSDPRYGPAAARGPGAMSYREFVAFMAALSIAIAVAIDITLPAFDEIKASLDIPAESNTVALTISVYFLGISIAQVFYGPLADYFGRKPVLYAGLIVYTQGPPDRPWPRRSR